jgi:hypothetical protein
MDRFLEWLGDNFFWLIWIIGAVIGVALAGTGLVLMIELISWLQRN